MINGTFLLFPTKGKTEDQIQSRLFNLKKMTDDENIFYAVFADSRTEDDYNSMMVLYAMQCKNIIISKDYKDDMMCLIAFDIVLNREDEHSFTFEE